MFDDAARARSRLATSPKSLNAPFFRMHPDQGETLEEPIRWCPSYLYAGNNLSAR